MAEQCASMDTEGGLDVRMAAETGGATSETLRALKIRWIGGRHRPAVPPVLATADIRSRF
jgi:hypothetical protein